MPNQNYAQVTEFVGQGTLSWETDSILAVLVLGGSFDPNHKKVSELTGTRKGTAPIAGRWLAPDGTAMGQPAVFQKVGTGEYQVIVAQAVDGGDDPNLLAFVDTNAEDALITVTRTGSLIVRPIEPDIAVPPERPPTIGVWMRLTA